ncbi:MAG: hypothetical protein HDS37_07745 [Bacteroides sp.]|nr:hypothetical protein [Bacteroides sp.]
MQCRFLGLFLSAVLAVGFAVGCADGMRYVDMDTSADDAVVIAFMLENVSSTRTEAADGNALESCIDHAYLLFYPHGSSVDGTVPLAAVRAEISESDPSALSFRMPLLLQPDTDYRLLAIANADAYVPDGFDDFADYLHYWCDDHSATKTPLCIFHADRILPDDVGLIPMAGAIAGGVPFRYTIRNGVYEFSASLSFRRLVARIDVVNQVGDELLIEGMALCNWRDAVAFDASEYLSGNAVGRVRGILSDEEDYGDDIFIKMPSPGMSGIQQLNGAFYCFPSQCRDASPADKESTALILKAKYRDDADPSYYRVNVGMSEAGTEVKSNTRYLVKVQSVAGRGAATPVEAYLSEEPPIVPLDLPFALLPGQTDRVKVNHAEHTIEIDAFAPDCFNSFIDIPFNLYVNQSEGNLSSVSVSTSMLWPLEGRICSEGSSQYTYCTESFSEQGAGQVCDPKGTKIVYSSLYKGAVSLKKEGTVYVSVGAMGPDDPAITRTITLAGNGKQVTYTLIVRPRAAIIDDVILTDAAGDYWLIQDRNIQDFNDFYIPSVADYIGVDSEGKKRQAYNYSFIASRTLTVPGKFDSGGSAFSESQHALYRGKYHMFTSTNKKTLAAGENTVGSRLYWLKRYSCSVESDGISSPFYQSGDGDFSFKKWVFPTEKLIELCSSRIKVSKMRVYLVSEVPVKDGYTDIPVCCYLPYFCWTLGDVSNATYGYYTASDGVNPDLIMIIYFEGTQGKSAKISTSITSQPGLSRLVRPLTETELEYYKSEYLGYGSRPYRLTICHPDTYGSTSLGWLSY